MSTAYYPQIDSQTEVAHVHILAVLRAKLHHKDQDGVGALLEVMRAINSAIECVGQAAPHSLLL